MNVIAKIGVLLVSLLFLSSFVKAEDTGQPESLEKLIDVNVRITDVTSFGLPPEALFSGQVAIPNEGVRVNISFEGTVSGQISGRIKGIDYATIYPLGILRLDLQAIIETDDGHQIAYKAEGLGTPRIFEPYQDIKELVSLRTNAGPYLWVNDLNLYGSGVSSTLEQTTDIQVFKVN